MKNNPSPESIPEMLKKLENEPVVKPFSCLWVFMTVFFLIFLATTTFCILYPVFFIVSLGPKQADFNRANEAIQRVNSEMDEFEETLQPLREQIEALDHRFPKSETQFYPIETER